MDCRYCQQKMILDDCDFNFKGNFDNYWSCENCNSFCFEQVRFGESHKRIWRKGENIQ